MLDRQFNAVDRQYPTLDRMSEALVWQVYQQCEAPSYQIAEAEPYHRQTITEVELLPDGLSLV